MATLNIQALSPLPVYLDEQPAESALAPRPDSLRDKVIGLLPNWRPSATELLKVVGAMLEQQCRPKRVVLEQAVSEVPMNTFRLLDSLQQKLDDLAGRVDVVVTATGD